MYFPSKKDKWLSVLIGLTVSVFLADGLFNLHWGVFMVPFLQGYYFIKLLVLVSFSVLLLWIWFITGYKLEEE